MKRTGFLAMLGAIPAAFAGLKLPSAGNRTRDLPPVYIAADRDLIERECRTAWQNIQAQRDRDWFIRATAHGRVGNHAV